MRWRLELGPRRPRPQQLDMPFRARARRLERTFKRGIAALTVVSLVALVGLSPTGRYAVRSAIGGVREAAERWIGMEPSRAEVEPLIRATRERTESQTFDRLSQFYRQTDPATRHLFDVTGMGPDDGLIGTGRPTNGFLLSSRVFADDDHGRSYRMRPNLRSVWLRQITLHEGPFGLFLVPDTPEVRAAAAGIGAIVDEGSAQTTNSWGCRGPEPDPDAAVRGVVIGDSFMLGMFNGDDDTPPLYLEKDLERRLGTDVSILNTGHIGYAPEQYYHTLVEYGARFKPSFVVVSVCPNDFGDEYDVIAGGGGDWGEAEYWLGEINQWCRTRQVDCVLAVVPCDYEIDGHRRDVFYPARVNDIFHGPPSSFICPLETFIDETLRLRMEDRRAGRSPERAPLYNRQINDNHFSPSGAALWAECVGRRVALVQGMHQANARKSGS